jgi:16S rRNA (adenine1518-N6/adenine1519-N6)-dimethyltransferase
MKTLIPSLYKPAELTQFLQHHGLRLTKALGQNFFIRKEMLHKILESAQIPTSGAILEIGPGIGNLTWVLIEHGLTVHAIEKDRSFIQILEQIKKEEGIANRLCIHHQDALEADLGEIARQNAIQHVIGNLPYNVAVPIMFHVAYGNYPFQSMNVMVQKEVGDRMAAHHGNKSYGRLSIVLQYLYTVKKIKNIPPTAFFPRPKVDSVFLQLTRKENTDLDFCRNYLERIVQIGFQHRRKKLRSQIKGAIIQKRTLSQKLDELEARFDLDKRAEDWPLDTWLDIAAYIKQMQPDE